MLGRLVIGANEHPMYRPKTPWWIAMNTSALAGDSTTARAEIAGDVQPEQGEFDAPVPGGSALQQRPQAGDVQVNALQGEQREEQPRLLPGDQPPDRAPAGGNLGGGEREHTVADIRVICLLIGMRVMPAVLIHPPAVAEPDEQIAGEHPDRVVAAARTTHLLVAAVMAEETRPG
jgi:hypothetical protein